MALAHIFLGEAKVAEEHASRALGEAERCGDLHTAGYAHSLLSFAALRGGRFRSGIEHGTSALEASPGASEAPMTRGWAGIVRTALSEITLADGQCERARSYAREALQTLRALGEPFGVALALRALGQAELGLGNAHEASVQLREAQGLFGELGAQLELAFSTVLQCSQARSNARKSARAWSSVGDDHLGANQLRAISSSRSLRLRPITSWET